MNSQDPFHDGSLPARPTRRIRLRRIKAGSLFALLLLASAGIFVPLFALFGTLAFFGAKTLTFSGEPMTGLKGLVAAAVMAPLFALVFTSLGWVGAYVGIRAYGRFRPIELEYVPATEATDRAADNVTDA